MAKRSVTARRHTASVSPRKSKSRMVSPVKMARKSSPGRRLRASSGTPRKARHEDQENLATATPTRIKHENEDAAEEGADTQSRSDNVLKDVMNRTQRLVTSLEATEGKGHLGMHALKDTLQEYPERALALGEGALPDTGLEVDWDFYRDWPEGLVQEEELLLDYFRKLKFIYLEQETKLRFLADLQDDPETGQEPQILSSTDVAQREHECKKVKQQLVEAKTRVRDLRAQIDSISDTMAEPWLALEAGAAEATALASSINDMELELAKTKAAEGTHGAMTAREAEEFCDAQILEMQSYDDRTTQASRDVEQAKKELAEAMRSLDKLRMERSAAEKYANDARLGMGRDRGRDLELERLCARHAATLECLQASLGIEAVSAPSSTELHIAFGAAHARRRTRGRRSSVAADTQHTLVLQFDEVGGQLVAYELRRDEEPVPLDANTAALAEAAMRANNVSALVQGVWRSAAAQGVAL